MTDRSKKIQSILDARRPMADRAKKSDEILNKIETQFRSFRDFIPAYAKRLDSDAATRINALLPECQGIIAKIDDEKGKLALLLGRFTRATLNIGVAGRAGQGKSTLLQKITGLTTEEIPSGNKGHCTGAPSIIVNHESNETFAEITFHTAQSFLDTVIAPFFQRLNLGVKPDTLDQFAEARISEKATAESKDPTTDAEHLKKLESLHENLARYRTLLTGEKRRITRDEIRSYVAQEDASGNQKLTNWIAVQMATIYCQFPHADLGAIAVADTPGLGDFLSGAEDRLVATVGKSLDVVLFVRRPPAGRPVIDPADTGLYGLISRAIPELPVSDWSYFVINKDSNDAPHFDYFQGVLQKSAIKTRRVLQVNCMDDTKVSVCLGEILNNVADNLESLDERLLERQGQGIKALAASIVAFAEKAASALPKATVVASNGEMLNELFGEVWKNIGFEILKLVRNYRSARNKPDEDFLAAVKSVFKKLDEGPKLPSPEEIDRQSANPGLQAWHGYKLHDLRVTISNSFEELNSCLDSSFDQLRNKAFHAFSAESGGKLGCLEGVEAWEDLLARWKGQAGEEVMCRTIETFLTAGLSFRGFIQPRVRECLDVLGDPDVLRDPEASKGFAFTPGDTPEQVKEKLELAWENACYECKLAIDKMGKEPAMARFAAASDFRDALLRTGGEKSKDLWRLFYEENRGEIWKKQFDELESGTRLRKEWENAVRPLRDAANSLAGTV
jgi:energy-coupling factor transporter ATP-binding protein EcfA2